MINKIFQIGFNRCGTVSLTELFKKYTEPKFNCIHWNNAKLGYQIQKNLNNNYSLLSGYERYDFFSDMESMYYSNNEVNIIQAYTFFDILDKQFPNSKFILNYRNLDDWIQSRLNLVTFLTTIEDNTIYNKSSCSYIQYFYDFYKTNNKDDIIGIWTQHFDDHIKRVRSYFKNRPKDLVEINIEEQSSFENFKAFFNNCGIDFIVQSLPILNTYQDRLKMKLDNTDTV